MTTGTLVVIRAGTAWDQTMMVDQHLALALADHFDVVYIDPVRSPLHGQANGLGGLTSQRHLVDKGILRVTPPPFPGRTRIGLRVVAEELLRRTVRTTLRRLSYRRAVLITVESTRRFRAGLVDRQIFWSTDDLIAGASLIGQRTGRRRRRDEAMARRSDVVVACSDVLRQRWELIRPDTIMIPNGVDAAAFLAPAPAPPVDIGLPRPIAAVVGTIGNRLRFDWLQELAASGLSLLLVGPLQRTMDRGPFEALVARENVQWIGFRPFSQLPGYLHAVDVGLTPYRQDAFNAASFPLKTLEYLAAGLPVISSDLPATRWLSSPLIAIADDVNDFVAKVTTEATREVSEGELRERQAFAAEHSWNVRGKRWITLVNSMSSERVRWDRD